MRANPNKLTILKPGEEIRPSIKFFPIRPWSENLRSIRFQADLVVNADYSESQYDNYRIENNVLPPGCVIKNLVLEVPIGRRK